MENEQEMTSVRVAANVREIRKARRLDLSDVSDRLDRVGQPISVSGLSKLETGSRRVAVDDLVALALVLDVTPSRLLLTATASADAKVQLAPNMALPEIAAWQWASGEASIQMPWHVNDPPEMLADRILRFAKENQPYRVKEPVITLEEMEEHGEALAQLLRAAQFAKEKTNWSLEKLAGAIPSLATLSHYMEHSEVFADGFKKMFKDVKAKGVDND